MKVYWVRAVGLSLLLHLSLGVWLATSSQRLQRPQKLQKVKIQLKPLPKLVQAQPEPLAAAKKGDPTSAPKPRPKNRKLVAPVQGLAAKSLSSEPSTFTAPLGNSLQTSDQGLRLEAKQVEALPEDLSAPAQLLGESVQKPTYTDAARDAELEGSFVVAVFVDAQGRVTEAELEQVVGFGMDERLRASALKARFRPRLDEKGTALSGWTTISFSLQID